jgi:hypothetical protein
LPFEGPAAADAAAFTLAHSAPDAKLLSIGEGVLEAILADDTTPAHLFGFTGRRTSLRKEQVWVNTHTVGLALPGSLLWPE